jgi:hypothetical protein
MYTAVLGEKNCSSCPLGTTTASTATEAVDGCSTCLAGRFRATSSGSCDVCGAGEYRIEMTAAETTSVCTTCNEGAYILPSAVLASEHDEANDCLECEMGKKWKSLTTDCDVCVAGTYSDQTAQTSCKECEKGTFLQDKATSANLHDNENDCLVCQALQFTTASGASACENCPAGYKTSVTENDVACESCIEGKFQPAIGQTNCEAEGKLLHRPGDATRIGSLCA